MKQAIDKLTMELPGMDTEQGDTNNPVHEAVLSYWGERCTEHEAGCPTCEAWKLYDQMTGELK
jgi:hypothetical protein